MKTLALLAALAFALAATAAVAEDNLCYVPGCECNPASAAGDLTDVVCKCVESQVRTGTPTNGGKIRARRGRIEYFCSL